MAVRQMTPAPDGTGTGVIGRAMNQSNVVNQVMQSIS
jgi:hypothetical protein